MNARRLSAPRIWVSRATGVGIAVSAFVLAYAAVLMWNPNYGFSNYEALREVIFASEDFFPSGVFPGMGRFYPMFVKEFALIQLFSRDIVWIYLFVSIQSVVFAWLMWRLLRATAANRWLVAVTLCALYLLPAFTNSWGAVATCERSVAFYLACLLLLYRSHTQHPRLLTLVLALAAANAAIYYKEPVFGAVVVFVLARLWIVRGKPAPSQRALDIGLLVSAAVFVAAYLVFAYLPRGPHLYGESASAFKVSMFRNLLNFALDCPVIVFLALPLAAVRLRAVLSRSAQAHDFYDPMLLSGTAYAFAFLVLNLYAPNYWLPVYVLTLPPLLHFLAGHGAKLRPAWKLALGITAFLLITNAIPLGMHILSTMKYPGSNQVAAMDALANDIRQHAANHARPAIFLDGVAPELTAHEATQTYDRDAYFNVAEALKRRGIAPAAFDLKSELPPKNPTIKPRLGDATARYTAFTQNEPSTIQAGDYLLITPNSSKSVSFNDVETLLHDYDLVYRTPPGQWVMPNLSLRTAIKALMLWSGHDAALMDRNLLRWSDYYLLRKRE